MIWSPALFEDVALSLAEMVLCHFLYEPLVKPIMLYKSIWGFYHGTNEMLHIL